MTRFSAIDLSQVTPPDIVETIDYETILQALKDDLTARLPDFDVVDLESEPVTKVLEVSAYREMLLRERVNTAAKAVLLATAQMNDLDRLGDSYAVKRFETETDEQYRRRVQLAHEAYSTAGPEGAYLFFALSASPDVRDAQIVASGGPNIDVYILSHKDNGLPDAALLEVVRTALDRETRTPLTDVVSVRSASLIPYDVEVTLKIPRGPDPDVLRQKAEEAVLAYAETRKRVGFSVPLSGLNQAAFVEGVDSVTIHMPGGDIEPGVGGVASLQSVIIYTQII